MRMWRDWHPRCGWRGCQRRSGCEQKLKIDGDPAVPSWGTRVPGELKAGTPADTCTHVHSGTIPHGWKAGTPRVTTNGCGPSRQPLLSPTGPYIQINTPAPLLPVWPQSLRVRRAQASTSPVSPCPCSAPGRHRYGEVRGPGLHSPPCVRPCSALADTVRSHGHVFPGHRAPSRGHIGRFRGLSGNWAGPRSRA